MSFNFMAALMATYSSILASRTPNSRKRQCVGPAPNEELSPLSMSSGALVENPLPVLLKAWA